MPLTSIRLFSFALTVVSSKESVKLPDSPQCMGSAAGASSVGVGIAASRRTVSIVGMELLEFDVNISNGGRSDRGVCRIDLVARGMVWRSEASGPVTVGYVPVQ